MASVLPSEVAESTSLPFFGIERAPFLKLSEPTEIFRSDQSALLNSHLVAATRRADSLVVILGADGVGKTTLLNDYVAGLGDEVCYAVFDETCVEAIQFYRSFLEQIGLGEIVGTLRELQHITSEYLAHRGKNGEHALIFVDNAHLVRPAVLEQLRWIADVKIDYMRAFSMVLAGGLNFRRIMDSPAMRSLSFRYQTCFHVRAFSEAETHDYIRHRLSLAGAADAVRFPDESHALIYRFTGGNPRLIDTLCNAVLAESCAQGIRVIGEQQVRAVAEAGKMPPHAVPTRVKGRRKSDAGPSRLAPDAGATVESVRSPPHQDVEIKELLGRITELSGQLERKAGEEKQRALMDARKHAADLDEKAKEISRLNAALLESERLRQDAGKARQSLADAVDALRRKLDASNKEVEKLTAMQSKYDQQIGGLTQAVAQNKVALADRDATIERLTAGLDELQATVASSAAEIARLNVARSGSRKTPPQDGRASPDSVADRKRRQRLTRRARAMIGSAQRRSENLERLPEKLDGTGQTETLLPGQMASAPTGEHATATTNGTAAMIELFLDGKPWKVMDLAGRPQRMMVGRAEDCDVRLDSKYVSRHHAILVNKPGSVAIEDLRSSNGIFVNTKKVDHSELRPGDTVAIGNFWLRFKSS